jgi:ATP-binding cassette subfamily B (MDR/TAP) protein 1
MYFIAYSAQALTFWQGSRNIADSVEGDAVPTVGRTYIVIFVLEDGT